MNLQALLGSQAEVSRTVVTTDSDLFRLLKRVDGRGTPPAAPLQPAPTGEPVR